MPTSRYPDATSPSGYRDEKGDGDFRLIDITDPAAPVQVSDWGIQDVGGPGKYRGGMSIRRDYRLLADEAILQVRADRHDVAPYGLHGGQPGQRARNVLNPGPHARDRPGKLTMTITRGDVFRHAQPGAGGWGDPLERDPARVLRDVRNELVSVECARDQYTPPST